MFEALRNKLDPFGNADFSVRAPLSYLFAVFCVTISAATDFALDFVIADLTRSIPYYPAIFIATLFGGVRAGIIASVLSATVLWWADTEYFGGRVWGLIQIINGSLYIVAAALIIWVAHQFRRIGRRKNYQADAVVRLAKTSDTINKSMRRLRQSWRDGLRPNSTAAYTFALACVLAATTIRFGIGQFGKNILPFACFYPTILFVALVGGLEAGLAAMALSLILVGWLFVPPYFTVGTPTPDQVVDAVTFLFSTALVLWLAEKYRNRVVQADRNASAIADGLAPIVVAFGLVLLVTFTLLALEPRLAKQHLLFGYLIPPIVIAILYGNTFAILTSFGCGIAAAYFLFPPKFSLLIDEPYHVAALLLFMVTATAISKLTSSLIHGGQPQNLNVTRRDNSLFFRGGARARTGVLLIHEIGGTPDELQIVAAGLAARGFTVACCELAGHGGTEDQLLESRWNDWFASAENALNNLRQQCDVIVIGGLSVGSILALRLAALHAAKVHGLCLYAPTLRYDGWAIPWYSFLLWLGFRAPFLRRMRITDPPPYGIKDEATRALVAGDKKHTTGKVPQTSLGTLQECHWLVRDVVRRLPTTTVPALIIHPREDDISDLSNTIFLQRRLGGLVQSLVLDDSYHMITVDRQRDVVMERTADFIAFVERRAHSGRPQSARPAVVAGRDFQPMQTTQSTPSGST